MTRLYLIKTGQTTFEQQSRVELAGGAPLTSQGIEDVETTLNELVRKDIAGVYSSAGEAERQTARIAGKTLGVKVRIVANLREIDYGLWQGLTVEEIRRRQPKAYRQWSQAPTTIRPPGGESLFEAQQRIHAALKSIVKRHKTESMLLVLRPIALTLLCCILEKKSPETLWGQSDDLKGWRHYEIDEESL